MAVLFVYRKYVEHCKYRCVFIIACTHTHSHTKSMAFYFSTTVRVHSSRSSSFNVIVIIVIITRRLYVFRVYTVYLYMHRREGGGRVVYVCDEILWYYRLLNIIILLHNLLRQRLLPFCSLLLFLFRLLLLFGKILNIARTIHRTSTWTPNSVKIII